MTTPHLQRLHRLAVERRKLERHLNDASIELRAEIRAAAQTGIPKSEIASTTQLSRQSVYNALRD